MLCGFARKPQKRTEQTCVAPTNGFEDLLEEGPEEEEDGSGGRAPAAEGNDSDSENGSENQSVSESDCLSNKRKHNYLQL